jgi:hypothetical protein
MSESCTDARRGLGAYLLGAIGPADRTIVDRHLDACARCRSELASLAGLPALLRRIPDPDSVLRPDRRGEEDSCIPVAALLSRTARIRTRRRALAAAAVGAMIAGTAAAASLVNYSSGQPPTAAAPSWQASVHAAGPATGARASIRYASRAWGTQIEAQISGVRPGTRCQLWVTGPDGERLQAGGWMIAAGHAGSWYPASSALPTAALRGFEITSASKILITIRVGSAQRR